jgi:hypothetical protein
MQIDLNDQITPSDFAANVGDVIDRAASKDC